MVNQELENENSGNQQLEHQQSASENSVFKKFKVFFEENLNFKPLNVAATTGIHATILSIIAGLVIGYGLYLYGKSQELQNQLFQEAAKINLISLNAAFPSQTDRGKRQDYDTSDPEKRKEVLDLLENNGWGSVGARGNPNAQRGYDTQFLLGVLYTHYPFAGNDAPKLPFNSTDQVKSWVDDLDKTSFELLTTLSIRKDSFQEDFNEITSSLIKIAGSDPATLEKLKSIMPPEMFQKHLEGKEKERAKILEQSSYSLTDYAKPAIAARELVTSVKSLLAQVEAQSEVRKSSKSILIIGLIVTFFGFLCGVVFPMINEEISPIIFLVIPIVIYCVVFIYTFYILTQI